MEFIIGHFNSKHCLQRNFLRGFVGDQIYPSMVTPLDTVGYFYGLDDCTYAMFS